jgi:hypothetical protein
MLSKMPMTNVAVLTHPPLLREESVIDGVCEQLRAGRIQGNLDELVEDLNARREEDPRDWPEYARACRRHPVCSLLHQDPFTHRAFAKPRGYAGDAVMMDYIYGLGEAREAARNATPLGRAIFQHFVETRPSSKAVRYRRRLIAGLIDRAARRDDARVLAIAAGHLREVELSTAMQSGMIREFTALDQDEASLAVVQRDYAYLGVRTIRESVRQILCGKAKLGQYDFVYAAGLFDYLSDPVAKALTCRMFEMTRPGGMMLIPNFLTGTPDAAYMEAFMDWNLIYRNQSDMMALTADLPRSAVADCRVFDDENEAITFLLVTRAG